MIYIFLAFVAGLIAFSGAVTTFSDAAVIVFFTLLGFMTTALMARLGVRKIGYRRRSSQNN